MKTGVGADTARMTMTAIATDCSKDNVAVGRRPETGFAGIAMGAALGSLMVVILAVLTSSWLLLIEPLGIVAALRLTSPQQFAISGFKRIVIEGWLVRWVVASLGLIGGFSALLWSAVLASFAIAGLWIGWRLEHSEARATRRTTRPARPAREPITLSSVVGVSFGEHHLRGRRHVRRTRVVATGEHDVSLLDSAT